MSGGIFEAVNKILDDVQDFFFVILRFPPGFSLAWRNPTGMNESKFYLLHFLTLFVQKIIQKKIICFCFLLKWGNPRDLMLICTELQVFPEDGFLKKDFSPRMFPGCFK